jgi:hypothetical protein
VNYYDGTEERSEDKREFGEKRRNIFGDYAYLESKTNDLQTEWNQINSNVNQLLNATKGGLDMRKCGYNPSYTARNLIYNYLRAIPDPKPTTPLEDEWILNAFKGGLIFGKSIAIPENAQENDVTSCYPYYMSSDKIGFPMTQGVFTYIQKL